jgi:iron complex outermembrane recepter protein
MSVSFSSRAAVRQLASSSAIALVLILSAPATAKSVDPATTAARATDSPAAASNVAVSPAATAAADATATAQETPPRSPTDASPAAPAGTAVPHPDTGQIVVTGSRVATNGNRAPTPVTVATSQQLQLAAPKSLSEGLSQLPEFKGSVGVQTQGTGTTGNNGASYLNLRGLGTSRTLVLLDGRRVVAASSAGSVDIGLLPEALIKQVEIVTGGASAAYGSDAVAGVVNFVLDTHFTGIKGVVQGGATDKGDGKNYKVQVAGGFSGAGGRLHAVGSIERYYNSGVEHSGSREWAHHGTVAITNPNVTAANPQSPSNPRMIVVENGYSSIAALGGLITNTSLRGTTFGPDGQPLQFQYGTLVSSTQMAGGGGYNPSLLLTLQPKQSRNAAFGHVEFEASPLLTVFAEGNYGRNKVSYNSLPTFEVGGTAFTIFQDNAFLPASVRNQMAAQNITSVTVGRTSPDLAIPHLDGDSKTYRGVVGARGDLGGSFGYNVYYEHGQNHSLFLTSDDPISDNLYRAADAVLSNGRIVCRSTITNPNDGCVPLDIFGYGTASAAALNYITGTAVQDVHTRQDVAEASVRGNLLKLPGGPLGVAGGVGYRKEVFRQVTDLQSQEVRTGSGIRGYPISLINTLGGYERTNPQPSAGGYNVKEAFAEVNAPLLADVPFAASLTLNGAVRYTRYSTTGGVTTWKIGAVYEPVPGFRLRGTQSRDIRAPSLGELFQGASQGSANITDPQRNNAPSQILTGNVGNTALLPEIANTRVLGFVLAPHFLPGFSASVDFYKIDIKNAISALSAQQELNLCAQGATEICGFIVRDSAGAVARVNLPFLNVASRKTNGIDIEANYTTSLARIATTLPGTLSLRLLANHLSKFDTQVAGAKVLQLAGDIGVNSTPKWSGLASANFDLGRVSVYAQERYIGSGKFDNSLGPSDISRNHVPAVFYTDATLNVDLMGGKRVTAFFTVNNLFDKAPPAIPGYLIVGSSLGNRVLYDVLGRAYTAGIRFRM